MRISITQLIMGVTLAALLLAFWLSEGTGKQHVMIESLSFSGDGSSIAVSKLMAKAANVPAGEFKAKEDFSRTISVVNTIDGSTDELVREDHHPGKRGYAGTGGYDAGLWYRGRQSVVMNPNSGQISATSFEGGEFMILNARTSEDSQVKLDHRPRFIALSRTGKLLAENGQGKLTVWNTETAKPIMVGPAGNMTFLGACVLEFSSDESKLYVVSDAEIEVWDVAIGQCSTLLTTQGDLMNGATTGPQGTIVVCAGDWVRQYDINGDMVASLQENGGCSLQASSSGGERLATIGNHILKLYEMEGEPDLIHEMSVDGSSSVAVSPQGKFVAVGDNVGRVSLYDFESGKLMWQASPPGRARSLQWPVPLACLGVWGLLATAMFLHANGKRHRGPS